MTYNQSPLSNPIAKAEPNRQPSLPPILSIGDLAADLIVSIPTLPVEATQHQVVDTIQLEPGGTANFLIAGARLGYPMGTIGAIGDDNWGQQVAKILQGEGIDLSGLRQEGTTTTVIVLVSKTGEHVFLGKYGHGSKIELVQSDVNLIKQAGAIYFTGYTLHEERLVNLTLEVLHQAKEASIPVFFDPGPQMFDVPLPLRHQILARVDTVLATAEELPSLVETGLISDLMKIGPRSVIVKHGSAGCVFYSQEDPLKAAGYPVSVVNTSAAGDSFNAAFMIARLWGWSLENCAKLANAVGAAKVQKLGGGRNVPTLSEVRAIIDNFDIGLDL